MISVTANIAPSLISGIYDAFVGGEFSEAQRLHNRLQKLCATLFIETNPVPVKTAVAMMGKIEDELRLPLSPLTPENRNRLAQVLREYELI